MIYPPYYPLYLGEPLMYTVTMTETTTAPKPKVHTVLVPEAIYAAVKEIAAKEERDVQVVVKRLLQKAVDSYQG